MLPRKCRLTKDKHFIRVARYGRRAYSSELDLRWIKNNQPYSRWGIVVSLKVDKKSVVRNKIKRRLRAILREKINFLTYGWDVIVIAKQRVKELDYFQLQNIFLKILSKNGLIMH